MSQTVACPLSIAPWKTRAAAHSLCTRRPRSRGPCAQAEWFIAAGRAAKKSVQIAGYEVLRGQHRSSTAATVAIAATGTLAYVLRVFLLSRL